MTLDKTNLPSLHLLLDPSAQLPHRPVRQAVPQFQGGQENPGDHHAVQVYNYTPQQPRLRFSQPQVLLRLPKAAFNLPALVIPGEGRLQRPLPNGARKNLPRSLLVAPEHQRHFAQLLQLPDPNATDHRKIVRPGRKTRLPQFRCPQRVRELLPAPPPALDHHAPVRLHPAHPAKVPRRHRPHYRLVQIPAVKQHQHRPRRGLLKPRDQFRGQLVLGPEGQAVRRTKFRLQIQPNPHREAQPAHLSQGQHKVVTENQALLAQRIVEPARPGDFLACLRVLRVIQDQINQLPLGSRQAPIERGQGPVQRLLHRPGRAFEKTAQATPVRAVRKNLGNALGRLVLGQRQDQAQHQPPEMLELRPAEHFSEWLKRLPNLVWNLHDLHPLLRLRLGGVRWEKGYQRTNGYSSISASCKLFAQVQLIYSSSLIGSFT